MLIFDVPFSVDLSSVMKLTVGIDDARYLYMPKVNMPPVKNAVTALNMSEKPKSFMAGSFLHGLLGESFNSSTGEPADFIGNELAEV